MRFSQNYHFGHKALLFYCDDMTGTILESKCMRAIFQKKSKQMMKKGKIFKNLGKNVQNLKIF